MEKSKSKIINKNIKYAPTLHNEIVEFIILFKNTLKKCFKSAFKRYKVYVF